MRTAPLGNDIYRILVEQTRDYAVFALDPGGNVLTWNTGAQRTKGYTAEEIIGRHFSTFYMRVDVERGWPEHELREAAAEGRFEDEGWRVRKDGSRFWANVVITALRDRDGRLIGYSKITRDLTERKAHDEALRQSEERFRLLIEGVTDYAIYMLSEDGIVTSWNAGAERIKGYSRDEIVGSHFSRFYLEEDKATEPWAELATAKRVGRVEAEGWRVRKSGERFWARVVVTALHEPDGRLRGFAKVTQDLSERRHAYALEQTAKRVSDFIAVLAHELRNPLAPVRNAVQTLLDAAPSEASRRELYRIIDRQSTQLVRIVDDMLDMTRIAKGLLSVRRDVVDMGEVIRRSLETAAPLFEARAHAVTVRQPPQAVRVSGDLHRLTQLLGNLLSNAARYTPNGGAITVALEARGESAVLRVIDNGRGIDSAAVESMFDMFVRERGTSDDVDGGLGIGLALSRKIAELHGGTLTGHSDGPGKGTAFELRLPALSRHAVPPPHAVAIAATSPAAPRRVMVVDDNVDAGWALDELVKSLGHQTVLLHDGREAIAAAAEFRPDIALVDIGMPGMNGHDVARALRAAHGCALRLVAVTGWGQEHDHAQSRAAGFDFHLVKPVGAAELAPVLALAVEGAGRAA